MSRITVKPEYVSINAVRDIAEPWIDLWGGDEWGESMRDALGASHTSYGFTDEDCATIAEILINNLIPMYDWAHDYGSGPWGYGWDAEDGERAVAETRKTAREARDYWLNGGNLGDWADGPVKAKETIDQLPNWLFEPEPQELEADSDLVEDY